MKNAKLAMTIRQAHLSEGEEYQMIAAAERAELIVDGIVRVGRGLQRLIARLASLKPNFKYRDYSGSIGL